MCVFFFKQKTAYEMRISDWSSDVCSSDLHTRNARRSRHECDGRHGGTVGDGEATMIADVIAGSLRNKLLVLIFTGLAVLAGVWAVKTTPLDAIPDLSDVQVIVFTEYPGQEIGRASCRERVCQ